MKKLKKILFTIKGIRSSSCFYKIEKEFLKYKEIKSVYFDFPSNRFFLVLEFSTKINLDFLEEKLKTIGSYSIVKGKIEFKMTSLHTKNQNEFKNYFQKQFPFTKFFLDLYKKRVAIEYLENVHKESEIEEFFLKNEIGFKYKGLSLRKIFSELRSYLSFVLIIPLLFLIFAKTGFFYSVPFEKKTLNIVLLFFTSPIFLFLGFPYYSIALKSLRNKSYNLEVLISLGVFVSYFYSLYLFLIGSSESYFDMAAFIILTMNISEWVELQFKKKKIQNSYLDFIELKKKENVILVKAKKHFSINLGEVKPGDHLWIPVSQAIPVDSILIKGETYLDESMINAEVTYRKVFKGDFLKASSINHGEAIEIKVQKNLNESFESKLFTTLEGNHPKKKLQKKSSFLDEIVLLWIPFILAFTLLTFLGKFIYFAEFYQYSYLESLNKAFLSMISLLLISCPYTIAFSRPFLLYTGILLAQQKKIKIRNIDALLQSPDISLIVFDKTGTLTKGSLDIENVQIFKKNYTYQKIILLATLLERNVFHPISQAFLSKAESLQIPIYQYKIDQFRVLKGCGLEGIYQNKYLGIGNLKFLESKKSLIQNFLTVKNLLKKDLSFKKNFFLIYDNELLALIQLNDSIKKSSFDLTKEIQKNYPVYILSGARYDNVKKFAKTLNIQNFYSGMLPLNKKKWIGLKQKEGKKVLMIGDGINDFPAMVQADLSISMSSGSRLTIQNSDLVLLDPNNLSLIIYLINFIKVIKKKLKINIFLVFLYNIIAIPLAILGYTNPMIGTLSIIVTLFLVFVNSFSLFFEKRISSRFIHSNLKNQ